MQELELACVNGDLEKIARLYDLDRRLFSWTFDFAEVKYTYYRGKNILHIACVKSKPEAILKLFEFMEKRAEGLALLMLVQKDKHGKLPLEYAMKTGGDLQLMQIVASKMGKHIAKLEPVSLSVSDRWNVYEITPTNLPLRELKSCL